ncbi:MAG: DNA repair and recombination protein RadB [Candidatus Woesearchaeota archaeon]
MDERISSGSDVFDELLEGGFDSGVITTIYGPAGSGKTTTCLLAALASCKKKVVFMDSEGGFSISRLKQLSKGYKEALDRIFVLKPRNFDQQKQAVEQIKKLSATKIGLIICDTISSLYRVERGNDNKALNRELGKQIGVLLEIAREKNIPVLLTNQVYADFDNQTNVKMVGGDILKYSSKCLIELTVLANGIRKATIKKHRSLPEKETIFKIVEKGFEKA